MISLFSEHCGRDGREQELEAGRQGLQAGQDARGHHQDRHRLLVDLAKIVSSYKLTQIYPELIVMIFRCVKNMYMSNKNLQTILPLLRRFCSQRNDSRNHLMYHQMPVRKRVLEIGW